MRQYDATGRRLPLPRAGDPPRPDGSGVQTHLSGVTAGMPRLLGEIESMAVDGASETDGQNSEE